MWAVVLKAWVWLASNPWRGAAIALALTVAYYHFMRVPAMELTIANQNTQIAKLQGDIKAQNQAVDNWKQQATQAAENQKQAMRVADELMKRSRDTVTTIMKEPVPTPDKECQGTFELLKKYQK
jgi:hypothetical protein